jgi:hypothetical protein
MKRQELIEKWLEALESGEYKQGDGILAKKQGNATEFCCLGVACVVDGRSEKRLYKLATLPETMTKKLGINYVGSFENPTLYRGKYYYSLAQANDLGVSFKAIAKIIRKNLAEGNFKAP